MTRQVAIGVLAVALVAFDARADDDPAVVLIYDGFGTTQRAQLWGRVLEDKGLDRPRKKESWYRRVKRSAKLLESDEIPFAKVEVTVLGSTHRRVADKDGLFSLELQGLPVGDHAVGARLLESKRRQRTLTGRVQVLPVASNSAPAPVAVVSDIDDTVLDSQVTSKRKLIWRALTRNAHQLQTFVGAPELFRAFRSRSYPIVFVSGSPINLYPRLQRFLALRGFPAAPMLLKNLGLSRGSNKLTEQEAYKLRRLALVRRLLPGYRLILIGDSGEKDPEIYATLRRKHSKAVAAVLIHRVTKEKKSAARFAGQFVFDRYAEAAAYLRRVKLLAGK